MCMCMPLLYIHVLQLCRYLRKPEEGMRSPGTGLIYSDEPLDMGAGNYTQVLCKLSALNR